MTLVVDSSSLIALARIGRLDLFRQLATTVYVPQAVHDEVAIKGRGRPGSSEVTQAEWITVSSVKDAASVGSLCQNLGRGESEAIVLAKETQADFVVLDDVTARRQAERMGCRVVGLLGVLLYAKQRRLIASMKPVLDDLREAGFYVDDRAYGSTLHLADELHQP